MPIKCKRDNSLLCHLFPQVGNKGFRAALGLHLTPPGPGIHIHCPDYPDLFLVLICTRLLNHIKQLWAALLPSPRQLSSANPFTCPAGKRSKGERGGQEAAEVTMESFSKAEIRNWSAHNVPSFSKGPLFLWGKVGAFFSFSTDLSDSNKPGVSSTDRNASCQSYLLQEKCGQTEQLFPAHTKAVPMEFSSVFPPFPCLCFSSQLVL